MCRSYWLHPPEVRIAIVMDNFSPHLSTRFTTLAEARTWARTFVHWYNHVHYHSAIGLLHPAEVHSGNGDAIRAARQTVLDNAYATYPERFLSKAPTAPDIPTAAWINKPVIHTENN